MTSCCSTAKSECPVSSMRVGHHANMLRKERYAEERTKKFGWRLSFSNLDGQVLPQTEVTVEEGTSLLMTSHGPVPALRSLRSVELLPWPTKHIISLISHCSPEWVLMHEAFPTLSTLARLNSMPAFSSSPTMHIFPFPPQPLPPQSHEHQLQRKSTCCSSPISRHLIEWLETRMALEMAYIRTAFPSPCRSSRFILLILLPSSRSFSALLISASPDLPLLSCLLAFSLLASRSLSPTLCPNCYLPFVILTSRITTSASSC